MRHLLNNHLVGVMVQCQTRVLGVDGSGFAAAFGYFFAFYGNFRVLGVSGTLRGSSPPKN